MNQIRKVLGLMVLGVVVCLAVGGSAGAAHLKHVYAFCAKHNCSDGKYPAALVADPAGNLFGLTQIGGIHKGSGTIFELVGGKKYKLLYTFCKKRDCSDGRVPVDLLVDTNGDLYGVAFQGGPTPSSDGLAFKLSHNEDGSVWTYEVLYAFCTQGGNSCTDGANPNGLTYAGRQSGVPYDGVSPLYGTAMTAYTTYRSVAFKLTPPGGARTGWTESVIYGFCTTGLHCPDGDATDAAPVMDTSGNLYGVTEFGGTHDQGVVYELSPGSGGTWTHTTLYTFCSLANCADGAYPAATLALDAAGNLYGTAQQGGVSCNSAILAGMTCGVVFKIMPNGASSTETVLHAFCVEADCGDGAGPFSTPLIDASGNIFGSASEGGGNDAADPAGSGVLFEIDNAGYHVLYNFCAKVGCRDGAGPGGGLLPDGTGGMLGTTFTGGPYNGGLVFRATP